MNTRGTGGGGHWLRIEGKKNEPNHTRGKTGLQETFGSRESFKRVGKKKRGREVGGKDLSVFAISKL